MPKLLTLKTFSDSRGKLTVGDSEIPFPIRRVYYVYGVSPESVRAGHRHKRNIQALICLRGSCEIFVNDGKLKQTYRLDAPEKCLILNPEDWHTMQHFSGDVLLLAMASEHYDVNDYIDEPYHD